MHTHRGWVSCALLTGQLCQGKDAHRGWVSCARGSMPTPAGAGRLEAWPLGKLEAWAVWKGRVVGATRVGVLCPLAAAAAVGIQSAGCPPEGSWQIPNLPETCLTIEAGLGSSLEAVVSELGSRRQEEVEGAWGARL